MKAHEKEGRIGSVDLRNPRVISRRGSTFVVEQLGRHREKYVQEVPAAVAEAAFRLFRGHELSAQEAADLIEPHAHSLGLPYHYGDKLRYHLQEILVVLVAMGRAKLLKVGNGFRYRVR